MRRRVVASLLVLLAAGAALAQDVLGKPAKTFPATGVVGMKPARDPLTALRGRTVLLVFFGTHYDKCTGAVPDMNKLVDALGPKGLSMLWVTEEERAPVEEWLAKTGLQAPVALLDTPTRDELNRHYPVPGYPTAFLLDPDGTVVWTGHPQTLTQPQVLPHLERVRVPPVLPPELADAQALLDAGEWAAARTALLAHAEGGKLDKRLSGWAKGTAAWIEKRRPKVLEEAAALAAKSWWWDAWETYDDYTRRFAGLEGVEEARQKAEAIRADPAAKDDLTIGDDVAKAKAHIAKKKPDAAKLILDRISKLTKSRFSERAKTILSTLK